MLTARELKVLLREEGLRLTKRLGQHHLVEARTIARLLDAFELSRADTVVEIGAGLGALTDGLAQRAGRVIAVEVDRKICDLLARRVAARDNVTVVCQDILTFPWEHHQDVVVVGAIPYHITSPILVALAEARRRIRTAWLIIQAEVADRLLARPASKAYGRLSVLGQYCWEIGSVLRVPRTAFFPQPAVDSCCLALRSRSAPPIAVGDERAFFAFVQRAFSHRRKTLVNCLGGAQAGGRHHVERALQQLNLPTAVRGEVLSLEQLGRLYSLLQGMLES